jgi:hypothetical protein
MADTPTRIVLTAVDNTKAAFDSTIGGLGRVSGAAGTLNGAIGRLLPLLGAATFTAFIKSSIDSADALNDLSARTGVAIETLAGLQLVATLGDTSLEALGKGMNKLSIFMAENSERARELGITSQEPNAAFVQLAETLSNVENVNTRNSIANEVLGKSYQELLPVLLQGGDAIEEQIRLGKELNPITEEMARNAAIFNDRLDELKLGASSAGILIANDLLPSLNEITENFIRNAQKAGIFAASLASIADITQRVALGSDEQRRIDRIQELTQFIVGQTRQLNEVSADSNKDVIANIHKRIAAAKSEVTELIKIQSKIYENSSIKNERPASNEDPDVKGNSGKSSTETLQEQIALIQLENDLVAQGVPLEDARTIAKQKQLGIGDEQIVQLLNAQGITRALAEEEKKREEAKKQLLEDEKIFMEGDLRAIETEMELQNEQLEMEAQMQKQQEDAQATYEETLESIQKETEELMFQLSLSGLSKKAQEEKIDARNVEIALQETLNKLAKEGLGLTAEEIEALRRKYEELGKLGRQVDTTKTKSNELGLTFKSALEDAIVDGEDLGDVLKGLEQDIIRILTRRMVTDPLTKGLDDLLDGIDFGGIFEGIFTANAKGGVYKSPSLSAYSGEVYNSPQVFAFAKGAGVFGEDGAEAIMPLSRGSNGKLGVQADMSGAGTKVVVNIIGAASQPQIEQRQDGNGNTSIDVIFDAVKGSLVKDIRSEGIFAQTLQSQYALNRSAGSR